MFKKLKKAKNDIMGDGNPFMVAKNKCKENGLSFNGFVEILFDFCKNFLIILFFYIFALILLKTFEKFVI